MRTMYDAVTAANIPRNAAMVAGYIDRIKLAPWTAADWARFPTAVKVTIVKKASTNDGHVLDVEPGDATPAQAPGWVRMRRAAGADPTVYMNLSTWGAVRAAFRSAGVAEPHYWIALYDGKPEWGAGWAESGVVAKQYRGNVAPGIDISSVADHWPGVDTYQEDDMPDEATFKAWVAQAVAKMIPAINDGTRNTVRYEVIGTPHDPADYRSFLFPDGRNLGDVWAEILNQAFAANAKLDGLTSVVAKLVDHPDVTPESLQEMLDTAVARSIQVSGELRVVPISPPLSNPETSTSETSEVSQ